MSAKSILFNTDMVRAILDGRKTVTRRLLKLPSYIKQEKDGTYTLFAEGTVYENQHLEDILTYLKMPYQLEDILYVRETWTLEEFYDSGAVIKYRAGGNLPIDYDCEGETYHKLLKFAEDGWVPSIFMPKEAARIWLKVTNVRVERLQNIYKSDPMQTVYNICSEGIELKAVKENYEVLINDFKMLWDSTIKQSDLDRYGWNANPWVHVIEFERKEKER
jgi:hypothetical protein